MNINGSLNCWKNKLKEGSWRLKQQCCFMARGSGKFGRALDHSSLLDSVIIVPTFRVEQMLALLLRPWLARPLSNWHNMKCIGAFYPKVGRMQVLLHLTKHRILIEDPLAGETCCPPPIGGQDTCLGRLANSCQTIGYLLSSPWQVKSTGKMIWA